VLTFIINRNNHITALNSTQQSQIDPEAARFSSDGDLKRLAKRWPGSRLVEIWNALPSQKPVKKFTNRKVALSRIWTAAQNMTPHREMAALRLVPEKAKVNKRSSRTQKPVEIRRSGKTGRVLKLLQRPEGATLKQLVAATHWPPHSVRGFLSGAVKKKNGTGDRVQQRGGRPKLLDQSLTPSARASPAGGSPRRVSSRTPTAKQPQSCIMRHPLAAPG
jgi:hypothetical protein